MTKYRRLAAGALALVSVSACTNAVAGPQVARPEAAAPGASAMPAIDMSRIPAPTPGRSDVAIHTEAATLSDSSVGAFRTSCRVSHMLADDPIVKPGLPAGSHLHTFFGNSDTTAYTTAESLRAGGTSTCDGGIVNRSAYWVPTIIDAATGAPIAADELSVYYKSGYHGVRKDQITAPPATLRMIAGSAKGTPASPQTSTPVRWVCSATGDQRTLAIDTSCPAGAELIAEIRFPQCWDGVNVDSVDHMSHMAYPDDRAGCPSSHPVAIPEITFLVRYRVPATGVAAWRLSSDNYVGDAGGYSLHADWFNGWDPTIMQTWLDNCTRQRDCQGNFLGDGRRLTDF